MFGFFTHRAHTTRESLFAVPQADPFENPLVETNPDQLRQWATTLPFANPQQLAESMITHLGRLNRYPKPVKKRPELMEIYMTPALRLTHGITQRKGLAHITMIRRVMMEMGYSYSHIANDCLKSKFSKKVLSLLSHSIYYAIKHFLLEYLLACEELDCRASATYHLISRLMTFATEQNLHQVTIEDKEQSNATHATIAHQFNLFLLFQFLDPCHLQEGEPRICFEFLNSVAGKAYLTKIKHDETLTGHYIIDRLGEVPPYLFHKEALETLDESRFVLFDLNPVSQILHQQLRRMERSEQTKPESFAKLTAHEANNLLARILKSWHIRLRRDSERYNSSGNVVVLVGVSQVHAFLAGPQPTQEPDQQEITMTQPTGITHIASTSRNSLNAKRSNQSRSGAALHLPRLTSRIPLIGELILISDTASKKGNDWKIGIVKRAAKIKNNQMEIGVQFLFGKFEPITLRAIQHHQDIEQQANDHPGVYIDQGHANRNSLIVPKHICVIGQEYRVEEMIPSPSVIPLQLLETTSRFERYRIKSV
jgi:hypothetical protein